MSRYYIIETHTHFGFKDDVRAYWDGEKFQPDIEKAAKYRDRYAEVAHELQMRLKLDPPLHTGWREDTEKLKHR